MEIIISEPGGKERDTIVVADNNDCSLDICKADFDGLLNPSFCHELREAINSSNIFSDNHMSHTEIQLLVRVAMFMEKMEQEKI